MRWKSWGSSKIDDIWALVFPRPTIPLALNVAGANSGLGRQPGSGRCASKSQEVRGYFNADNNPEDGEQCAIGG